MSVQTVNDLDPLRIGIAGLGTVGAGVVEILLTHREMIKRRTGRAIEISAIAVRDHSKKRDVNTGDIPFVETSTLALRNDVDVVVELIGGSNGPALSLARDALKAGKSFVTANKALIAHHGRELASLASENHVSLAFEAGVAGGVPILKSMREGLASNEISRVYGIMNGTCNYILTKMENTGASFGEVLAEAQELGYAEADPTFDVDGIDTAHKLAILSSLAFGTEINFESVDVEGIRHINALDIKRASELGYRIKLLGVARRVGTGIEQRVHPTMVPIESPIAAVNDVYNAIVCEGDFIGRTVFEGPGAGRGPTASAVVSDLIDVARGIKIPAFGVPVEQLRPFEKASSSQYCGGFYIRLTVNDRVGVLADLSAILRDHNISIESLIQRGRSDERPVHLVIETHDVREQDIVSALEVISGHADVIEPPYMIRIENN